MVEVRYPRLPEEDAPDYTSWSLAIRRELDALDDGAAVVGHSVGGTVLINLLAQEPPPRRLGAIVLVAAPFLGSGGWPNEDVQTPPDLGSRLPSGVQVHLFHGLHDETVAPSHLDLYARVIPQAQLHWLPGRDHQLHDDLSEVAEALQT